VLLETLGLRAITCPCSAQNVGFRRKLEYVNTFYKKCLISRQLDATEVFIADLIACSTCFGNHFTHHQELKSIIRWLLPVVFRAVVFKLLVWCGAEGYVSGLQDVALLQ